MIFGDIFAKKGTFLEIQGPGKVQGSPEAPRAALLAEKPGGFRLEEDLSVEETIAIRIRMD